MNNTKAMPELKTFYQHETMILLRGVKLSRTEKDIIAGILCSMIHAKGEELDNACPDSRIIWKETDEDKVTDTRTINPNTTGFMTIGR